MHIETITPTIKCEEPARHESWEKTSSGHCVLCGDFWLNSLPWHRPYAAEDELLKARLRVPDSATWHKEIIRDVWAIHGNDWQGYIAEFFSYTLTENATEPYKLLCRIRICYEPEMIWTPVFLEILWKRPLTSQHMDISIRGLDRDLDLEKGSLTSLLRAHAFFFDSESLSRFQIGKRGGARHVKMPVLSEDLRRKLGKRYVDLKSSLKNLKRDARVLASTFEDWHPHLLRKYSVLQNHHDFVKDVDPYHIPEDADASERVLAQWEIAMQIAALEVIPGYRDIQSEKRPSAEVLREVAIFPPDEGLPASEIKKF